MPPKSWLSIPRGSHFSLANIPFGIISHPALPAPHPAIAIGDHALDLQLFTAHNGFRYLSTIQPHSAVFSSPTLNAFAALGRPLHSVVRKYIQSVLLVDTPYPDVLRDNETARAACLVALTGAGLRSHLPMHIRDYTDFYAGMNHARNCGVLFRGPANALQPNYKHMPIGYHGRASSVVVSGTPVRRPRGQILQDPAADVKAPVLAPCRRLDMELELAAFVCRANDMGEPVAVDDAAQHLFGLVLMNDWSARDVQAWEAVPLGPFNAKNFGTSVSAWVVLMEALEPFRAARLESDVAVLPYLAEREAKSVYDIRLQVDLTTEAGGTTTITRGTARDLLFSFPQMIAHHTVSGCPLSVGDLLGSGTISGTDPGSCGSLLEQTQGGKRRIELSGGESRLFLEDGDRVTMTGVCGDDEEGLVGFGECTGHILPAPH